MILAVLPIHPQTSVGPVRSVLGFTRAQVPVWLSPWGPHGHRQPWQPQCGTPRAACWTSAQQSGCPTRAGQSWVSTQGCPQTDHQNRAWGKSWGGEVAFQGLAGALQDRRRCQGGQPAARTPTRTGSPSTAGPPSTPPSWLPLRAAAATGTRSAGGLVSAPAVPNAHSERDLCRAAAVGVSPALCHPLRSTYSELSGCTQLLAQLLSCPWPSAVLDAFFLQVHAEYFTNCTGAEPPRLGELPPGMAVAVAMGLSCLVPLATALTLSRARRGAQTPAGSYPAPACP